MRFLSILLALVASATAAPIEMVLADAQRLTPVEVTQWKKEGVKAMVLVLDEQTPATTYRAAARHISIEGLDLYWWIEVARNPKMAEAHPRWMAALGSHDDWQKNFPRFPEPAVGEVAKAFPWVPIHYREAFDAHLQRIEQLLKRVPDGWRGLLLNDLQGGPSSCGCGNVLCRWAIDYYVPSTATKLEGDAGVSNFVAEVRKRAPSKTVVPVWTTECEDVDLPADKNRGQPGTGLCGSVGCATGACPKEFAKQWSALISAHEGPIGLLALHTALQRTRKDFGGGPQWVTNAIGYLNKNAKPITSDRLWVVVEDTAARDLAVKADVGAVIVSRTKIDQSYEPRMVSTK